MTDIVELAMHLEDVYRDRLRVDRLAALSPADWHLVSRAAADGDEATLRTLGLLEG